MVAVPGQATGSAEDRFRHELLTDRSIFNVPGEMSNQLDWVAATRHCSSKWLDGPSEEVSPPHVSAIVAGSLSKVEQNSMGKRHSE